MKIVSILYLVSTAGVFTTWAHKLRGDVTGHDELRLLEAGEDSMEIAVEGTGKSEFDRVLKLAKLIEGDGIMLSDFIIDDPNQRRVTAGADCDPSEDSCEEAVEDNDCDPGEDSCETAEDETTDIYFKNKCGENMIATLYYEMDNDYKVVSKIIEPGENKFMGTTDGDSFETCAHVEGFVFDCYEKEYELTHTGTWVHALNCP
mmetsp:Transcript_26102/g.38635  ORF Transcript_26102/g.38635 Transcript_26102/m.38635 type:complete len:203 (-) Transcript_26102:265-873(-)|eukprot:CAMPEP_0195516178 /NCGR_PEP_ID=MMETSP0794_2-20130614/6983_1 /TAXON_ID=515487 /ORGANISM="Stephanopyxis turris, Strain CCMP 815" /LENGTH=202 /DNA_ID=CAMNT_0040644705 /DNA_START=472 /DNA_END=1083 /DNA_ORIENTATION=+